jgi:subtilisin family serine protease
MKLFILLFLLSNLAVNASSFDPNYLVIKMRPGVKLPTSIYIKNSKNLFENIYIVKTNELELLEASLKNNPGIEYTEKSFKAEKTKLPTPTKVALDQKNLKPNPYSEFNDPFLSKVWSFKDANENGISINASYKENGKAVNEPIIVAVVDTGVDVSHEDLKDVIWTNTKEIPGNGIDDDHNGYIDDVHGINTLQRDSKGNATGDIRPIHPHGTHVSGTIAAKQNNGIGIAGIASNVKIMPILTVPNSGDETDINVAEAFVYAAKNGARLINCSFGKSYNDGNKLIPDTLKYIADKYGVLVIVAAGNESMNIDNFPTYPASFPNDNLLVVASTTSRGTMSSFSNYGIINVDVAAPGSSILSTVPGNKYENMSGTSMATPATVGVAAEILSHYPKLTYLQLKNILISSVTKVDDLSGKMVSEGRIDLQKGIELARSIK